MTELELIDKYGEKYRELFEFEARVLNLKNKFKNYDYPILISSELQHNQGVYSYIIPEEMNNYSLIKEIEKIYSDLFGI